MPIRLALAFDLDSMNLRTKLITAFLALAILPLAGIVLFSYLSSLDAFRQAVEAETAELARDITRTMEVTRSDFRRRFSNIGSMPAREEQAEGIESALGQAVSAMASSSAWIEAVRVIPEALAEIPGAVNEDLKESLTAGPSLSGGIEIPIPELSGLRQRPPRAGPPPDGPEGPEVVPNWMPPAGQAQEWKELIEHLSTELPKVRLEFEKAEAHRARALEREEQRARRHEAASERRRSELVRLFGDGFRSTVRSGDLVLGELEADISVSKFLRSVLTKGRREKGEIPFAVDPGAAEPEPYTANDEDLDLLLSLTDGDSGRFRETFGLSGQEGDEERLVELDDWIAVTRQDPESGIIFGIARPIGESLAQIRQTAVRNFVLGGGMVSLALLGILPLSGRMTRELQRLTEQVDRLATGDLEARATANGRDEIGQLARSFNRMASDLEDNQERILEQEREVRERELREELLAAENQRRGVELEEARRFQLSLLPRTLPQHPEWEVAVLMRTATEVGGDYYDFAPTEQGLVAALGDAAGHGARAGTMVAVLKTLFSSCEQRLDPEAFLAEAAATIRGMRLDRMTMSMAVAALPKRSNRGFFCWDATGSDSPR